MEGIDASDTGDSDTGAEGGERVRTKRLGYHSYYSLPPGWYEADWNYSPRPRGYRPRPHNWAGRRPKLGPVAGFWLMNEVDNWRKRGEYYDEYYKMTGKKPRYYNKITRKRIKW